jgi:UDP-glucose 4,6-dehydratase
MTHERSFSTILVTGGCGFIGSNFISEYRCMYPNVFIVNVDIMDYCADEENIPNRCGSWYKLHKVDVCDSKAVCSVLREHKPEAIIHFAAQTHVDNSFGNSIPFTQNNVLGTHILLESCRKELGTACLFLHISTDEVYGEVSIDHPGCCEKSILNPTNPYAATKAAAEFIVRSYHHSYNLPVMITRGNNVYGPRQYPEKLIPRFITQYLKGAKFTIQGTGCSRRNFVYVQDVVRAVITVLHRGVPDATIYNVGGRSEHSVLEVAEFLRMQLAPEEKLSDLVTYIPDRAFNDQRYAINTSALKSLGWKEEWSFTDGIKETIKWYKSQLDKYANVPHVRRSRTVIFSNRTDLPPCTDSTHLPIPSIEGLESVLSKHRPSHVVLLDERVTPGTNTLAADSRLETVVTSKVVFPIHLGLTCKSKCITCTYVYNSHHSQWSQTIIQTLVGLGVQCVDRQKA